MSQHVGVQRHSRFAGVVLKHLLDRSNAQRCPESRCAITRLRLFSQHNPQMIRARIRLNPHLGNIHIKQAQDIRRHMHKAVVAISSLGSRSVLIVRAKPDMDALLAECEILHAHAEQLAKAKAPFFEHQTQQTITKSCGISIGVFADVNTAEKGLEVLL